MRFLKDANKSNKTVCQRPCGWYLFQCRVFQRRQIWDRRYVSVPDQITCCAAEFYSDSAVNARHMQLALIGERYAGLLFVRFSVQQGGEQDPLLAGARLRSLQSRRSNRRGVSAAQRAGSRSRSHALENTHAV